MLRPTAALKPVQNNMNMSQIRLRLSSGMKKLFQAVSEFIVPGTGSRPCWGSGMSVKYVFVSRAVYMKFQILHDLRVSCEWKVD